MEFDWVAWKEAEHLRNITYKARIASRLLKARREARRLAGMLKEADAGLSSIILFGSTARGDPSSDRFDIDIAVEHSSCFALLEAATVAEGFTVDLIQLEYAPPRLRENIEREGIVL
ncbi:MAG: hypothetical protein A2Z99_04115 [Treponema sp. GWB1_62_6]|nr:MAG: hypothetical protein A2Z99_04115 [Treponema sp. GWB1_62_6]